MRRWYHRWSNYIKSRINITQFITENSPQNESNKITAFTPIEFFSETSINQNLPGFGRLLDLNAKDTVLKTFKYKDSVDTHWEEKHCKTRMHCSRMYTNHCSGCNYMSVLGASVHGGGLTKGAVYLEGSLPPEGGLSKESGLPRGGSRGGSAKPLPLWTDRYFWKHYLRYR